MERDQIKERIRLYFKTGQKDYDEFDAILLQLSMHMMTSNQQTNALEDFPHLEDIQETFSRRASRHEFPAVKYIVYLQYAALMTGDQALIDSLVRYGFDEIYQKLRWPDKVTGLEIACSMRVEYAQKLLDKVAVDILKSEYKDLMPEMNTNLLIQAMSIYHQMKYQR
jgi:hypothetical protein